MNSQLRTLSCAFLLGLLNGGVCADEKADADAQLSRLRNEITALVGRAKCVNLVNWRIVALGANACGGPHEYIAYSWLSTEKATLETRIAEYNFAFEDAQAGTPGGACTALPEPVAACMNGRCVIPGGR